MKSEYMDFLKSKMVIAPTGGIDVDESEISEILKPHQRDAVMWALKGGRRAIFAAFGMGKSIIQLEWSRILHNHVGGKILIVCPLGVKQEFVRDARELLHIEPPVYIKNMEEAEEAEHWLLITNYERVRDGNINPKWFTGTSLDEAAVLRSFGSKTYQEFLPKFRGVKYKLVSTATPSPNKYKELIHYAGYLEIMDTGQALAQPLSSKVLTPYGWVTMGDVKIGDMVVASNGKPTKVLAINPRGVEEIFKVTFSDGTHTRCTADHLWTTQTQYERNNQKRFLERNPDGDDSKYWTVKSTSKIAETLICTSTDSKNHMIPMVKAVEFEKQETLLEPWLLGYLLGNGYLRKTSVMFSTEDDWVVEKIRDIVFEYGLNVKKLDRVREDGTPCYDYTITAGLDGRKGRGNETNQVLKALRQYGLLEKRAWEKHIPEEYIYNDVQTRISLMQGLLDSDGHCTKCGTVQFTTTSEKMAEQIEEIARSLGGTTYKRTFYGRKPNGEQGRIQYRVTLRLPNEIIPFKLPRKAERVVNRVKYTPKRYITSVEPDGKEFVQCIYVEDDKHLYVTDDYILTHNTRFFKRDSTKANNLTLYPHKEKEFWLWLSTWALFIQKPSDLGYDDTGYALPPLEVRYHKIQKKQELTTEKDGQIKMFQDAAEGLKEAAREKRESIDVRVAKAKEIVDASPEDHFILWHDLEAERAAIKKAMPECVEIYGSQDLELREKNTIGFSEGEFRLLATKKELSGSGCNFQRYCHREIFIGIDYEFNDFIQAIHRCFRFLQRKPVIIDIIYMDTEQEILKALQRKWKQYNDLVDRMEDIIKEYGIGGANAVKEMKRSIGVERVEVKGNGWTAINNDCIEEAKTMKENSIDEIITSIPFSNHYEYTAKYNDFGHNENTQRFFEQMDFLSPELLRILKPGRVFACHVKDRVLFGNATGTGMPTMEPFHAMCIKHYMEHGFQYFGMITVVTDVVRENNQTYRLGWSEQCKDGTKMGVGCPEYILLFRKLPTDTSKAYADEPVTKSKEEYTRARWQIDAHGFQRSSGNRLLTKDEIMKFPVSDLQKVYRKYSRESVYDYDEHVKMAEQLDKDNKLPASFMVVAPGSWMDDVWDDINRMRTMNTLQSQKGKQMHVCLAKGSLILTRNGYKPIEEISIGDMVLTHKGNWKAVVAKQCTGIRETIQTKAQGVPYLVTTPDHKLWARKTDKVRAKDYLWKTEPKWIEANDLYGGWVNLKLPQVEESTLTSEEWWIVGRYLADGHIGTRGDFFISVGNEKIEEFEEKARPWLGTYRELSAVQYRLKNLSKNLKEMLKKCGHGAINKQVPIEGICLDKEKSEALLSGYLSGDGNVTGNHVSASSISRALLLGMAMVAQRARSVIASVYASKKAGKHVIEGREINQNQLWVLSWRDGNHKFGELLDDGAWKKVHEPVLVGNNEVWSIQVDEDASYTAEGCIVKNCPLQLDIVDRLINRYSNPGDTILDPFGGLMTVPVRAIKAGRNGIGIELNTDYFRDGVGYLKAEETKQSEVSLFDFVEAV